MLILDKSDAVFFRISPCLRKSTMTWSVIVSGCQRETVTNRLKILDVCLDYFFLSFENCLSDVVTAGLELFIHTPCVIFVLAVL